MDIKELEQFKNERQVKGVWIPIEIWENKNLTLLEKIIYIEIDSLSNENKNCYASNKYLADFCNCSETRVSKIISKLCKLKMIKVIGFNGRQRMLKTCLKYKK